jgi:hypothetical protein
LGENRKDAEKAREEYDATAAHLVVQWISSPGCKEPGDRGRCINETHKPRIMHNAKLLGKGKISPIGTGVIPSLDSRAE